MSRSSPASRARFGRGRTRAPVETAEVDGAGDGDSRRRSVDGAPVAGMPVAGMPVAGMPDDGRTAGFERLYRRKALEALRYAVALVGPGEAEDAHQEAWLRIWRAWGSADPDRLDAWALRVVRNCCLDRLRRRAPEEPLGERELCAPFAVEERVLCRLEVDAALRLLGGLPLPLREALWLREVGSLSYVEIADLQGVPVGTVMSRLHAGRRRVARRLDRERW